MNPTNLVVQCPNNNCKAKANLDLALLKGATIACPKCKQDFAPIGHLDVITIEGIAQQIPLAMGNNIIGRKASSSTAQLQIETADRSMSRQHCQISIEYYDNRLWYIIADAGSTQGTFLDAERKQRLSQYDQIYLSSNANIYIGQARIILTTLYKGTGPEQSEGTVLRR